MTDKVKEVYNSLQERLKSPFLLTFIVVWSIKHWRLILIVLNFKETENAISKQTQIEDYIKGHLITIKGYDLPNWVGMILPVLFWSIVSIMSYYLITIITESIAIWYKRLKSKAMVFLNESRAVVTKGEYDIEVSKANRLQTRNEALTKRMGELENQYNLEKKVVDASVESLRNELIKKGIDLEKSLLENSINLNNKENLNNEIEKLNDTIKVLKDEIELFNQQRVTLSNRISNRNSKIVYLLGKVKNAVNLNVLQSDLEDESIVNIDTENNKNEVNHVTKTSFEASQILKEIFGFDRWQYTAYYPNDKVIKEKFRLHNNYFLLDTGEKILIDHVFLNKDDNTIRFTKANFDTRYTNDELETKLEIKGKNELIGKEPDNVNVTYIRI